MTQGQAPLPYRYPGNREPTKVGLPAPHPCLVNTNRPCTRCKPAKKAVNKHWMYCTSCLLHSAAPPLPPNSQPNKHQERPSRIQRSQLCKSPDCSLPSFLTPNHLSPRRLHYHQVCLTLLFPVLGPLAPSSSSSAKTTRLSNFPACSRGKQYPQVQPPVFSL